jgi:hypothetical protein
MKKLVFIFTTLVLIAACTGTSKDKETKDTDATMQQDSLAVLEFKIDGLQDSIVSDSIWRIIMQVEGVSQVVLSKADSMAVFEVNPELVSSEMLEEEIRSRGGILLN